MSELARPAICFVLVRPARAENVGAAARALTTMGFRDLRIVASDAHREPAAQWVAHGAGDVLHAARAFNTLAEALQDCDWVVGTSAKPRLPLDYPVALAELPAVLAGKAGVITRAAVVFGCEESGLSNAELSHCHLLSCIPLAAPQPSLNLAQAVMLYAYELATVTMAVEARVSSAGEYEALQARVTDVLTKLGVAQDEVPARWAQQRLAFAEARDVRLLHFLLSKLEQRLPG